VPGTPPPVILYDGVCGLCNRFVQFVIQKERREDFVFAALLSSEGQRLLRTAGLASLTGENPIVPDTIVLLEDGQVHFKSEAALRVCARLRSPWSLLAWLRWVPRQFRDLVYDFVARHRYGIFGKLDACPLPDPRQRSRFL
jgi:predicted DCC family thiol-disulfide oxidoreductase YuxK